MIVSKKPSWLWERKPNRARWTLESKKRSWLFRKGFRRQLGLFLLKTVSWPIIWRGRIILPEIPLIAPQGFEKFRVIIPRIQWRSVYNSAKYEKISVNSILSQRFLHQNIRNSAKGLKMISTISKIFLKSTPKNWLPHTRKCFYFQIHKKINKLETIVLTYSSL